MNVEHLLFTWPCALQLVGVRIPDHAFMRRLCQMCGEPLALTSANISSHTSTVAVNVSENMKERYYPPFFKKIICFRI